MRSSTRTRTNLNLHLEMTNRLNQRIQKGPPQIFDIGQKEDLVQMKMNIRKHAGQRISIRQVIRRYGIEAHIESLRDDLSDGSLARLGSSVDQEVRKSSSELSCPLNPFTHSGFHVVLPNDCLKCDAFGILHRAVHGSHPFFGTKGTRAHPNRTFAKCVVIC